MLPSITTIKILKSTEELRRFAQRGGVRGIVSSASSCVFALILLTQLERKERRENNARLIKRLKVFFAIELNISALLCTYTFDWFTFDVSVTHACMTRVYLWIDARLKMKTSAYCSICVRLRSLHFVYRWSSSDS